MGTRVFYAWQSDRDVRLCRYLILSATRLAIKKLKSDARVQEAPPVELDHDTKGLTGHPHVAAAIRTKIKNCAVFMADLTHVAEYETADGRLKHSQNPNVLIELGMAIRAKGFSRLILIMNDAFGSPHDLPFDLKSHSYPITYTVASGADKSSVRAAQAYLAERIAEKLEAMLRQMRAISDSTRARIEQTMISGRDRAVKERARFERQLVTDGLAGLRCQRHGVLAISLIPIVPLTEPIRLGDAVYIAKKLLIPFSNGEREFDAQLDRLVCRIVRYAGFRKISTSIALLDEYGSILVAHALEHEPGVAREAQRRVARGAENTILPELLHGTGSLLDWDATEQGMISRISDYLQLVRRVCSHSPVLIGASLLQSKGTILFRWRADRLDPSSALRYPGHLPLVSGQRPLATDDLVVPPVIADPPVDGRDHKVVAGVLRPVFDALVDAFGGLHDPTAEEHRE